MRLHRGWRRLLAGLFHRWSQRLWRGERQFFTRDEKEFRWAFCRCPDDGSCLVHSGQYRGATHELRL